jgi:hypothetical protein
MPSTEKDLAEPFQKFPGEAAFRAKRLIGFDTGNFELKLKHESVGRRDQHAMRRLGAARVRESHTSRSNTILK